jgi:hypothetical protein
MEMKFVDGDYVPDGRGGFETVSSAEELINRVAFKLKARRGGFPLMPDLGSRLHLLGREKPSNRANAAKSHIAEALADERGLTLDTVDIRDLSGGSIEIQARFYAGEEALSVSLGV